MKGSGTLGIAEFLKRDTNRDGFTGIVEKATEFSFSNGGNHFFEAMSDNKNGAVTERRCGIRGVGGVGAEEEESSVARARVGLAEVGGITVDVETHVAGMVANDSVGVRGGVI